MQLDRTLVRGLEICKALLQLGCGIAQVFHDMRGEPSSSVAYLLQEVQQLQAGLCIGGTIIHSRKDVGVDVGLSLKDACLKELMTPCEKKHFSLEIRV